MVRKLLGEKSQPPDLPDNILHNRLVDVFTAASDNDMREEVLAEFCETNSRNMESCPTEAILYHRVVGKK